MQSAQRCYNCSPGPHPREDRQWVRQENGHRGHLRDAGTRRSRTPTSAAPARQNPPGPAPGRGAAPIRGASPYRSPTGTHTPNRTRYCASADPDPPPPRGLNALLLESLTRADRDPPLDHVPNPKPDRPHTAVAPRTSAAGTDRQPAAPAPAPGPTPGFRPWSGPGTHADRNPPRGRDRGQPQVTLPPRRAQTPTPGRTVNPKSDLSLQLMDAILRANPNYSLDPSPALAATTHPSQTFASSRTSVPTRDSISTPPVTVDTSPPLASGGRPTPPSDAGPEVPLQLMTHLLQAPPSATGPPDPDATSAPGAACAPHHPPRLRPDPYPHSDPTRAAAAAPDYDHHRSLSADPYPHPHSDPPPASAATPAPSHRPAPAWHPDASSRVGHTPAKAPAAHAMPLNVQEAAASPQDAPACSPTISPAAGHSLSPNAALVSPGPHGSVSIDSGRSSEEVAARATVVRRVTWGDPVAPRVQSPAHLAAHKHLRFASVQSPERRVQVRAE